MQGCDHTDLAVVPRGSVVASIAPTALPDERYHGPALNTNRPVQLANGGSPSWVWKERRPRSSIMDAPRATHQSCKSEGSCAQTTLSWTDLRAIFSRRDLQAGKLQPLL